MAPKVGLDPRTGGNLGYFPSFSRGTSHDSPRQELTRSPVFSDSFSDTSSRLSLSLSESARLGLSQPAFGRQDGGGFCSQLVAFDADCQPTQTEGSFIVELPDRGTYNVSLELHSGGPNGTLLSETQVLVQSVSCSGTSATPRADLGVNF